LINLSNTRLRSIGEFVRIEKTKSSGSVNLQRERHRLELVKDNHDVCGLAAYRFCLHLRQVLRIRYSSTIEARIVVVGDIEVSKDRVSAIVVVVVRVRQYEDVDDRVVLIPVWGVMACAVATVASEVWLSVAIVGTLVKVQEANT
jgi:hypothetical protein